VNELDGLDGPESATYFGLEMAALTVPAGVAATASGYYSWPQPPSTLGGYEGYCGQTAIANLAAASGVFVSPAEVGAFCWDPTPGTLPTTFIASLNQVVGAGPWGACAPTDGADPILWLHSQIHGVPGFPVATMIALPGGALHWVTVVAVTDPGTPQCSVTYLEYGTQTSIPCATFDGYWSLAISLTGVAVDVAGIVSPYTTVCRVAPPSLVVDQPPVAPIPTAVTVGCFAGDLPSDVWQRCRTVYAPWIVQRGLIWDTTCQDIWADHAIGADDWRSRLCADLVGQCIDQTRSACAAVAALPPAPAPEPLPM
jgi:hypothetical protein